MMDSYTDAALRGLHDECRHLREQLRRAENRNAELEETNSELLEEIENLKHRLKKSVYGFTPRPNC